MSFYKKHPYRLFTTILTHILLLAACSDANNNENTAPPFTKTAYGILVNANSPKGTISPLLMGFGIIYSFEKDAIWQNSQGMMPNVFKRLNTGVLRYLGGTLVKRYHWNNLNGEGWKDNWNPNYDLGNDKDPSEFLDVDEYILNINTIGEEPMLGINRGSGLKYNRVNDGIKINGFNSSSASATSFVANNVTHNQLTETDVYVEGDRLILYLPKNSLTKIVVKK